ncbi:hypothetical protein [Bradyrhizobium sp. Ce-3]|uniref:hypothetical protein n=1 Tax=Bradyrhizobium sp. Ce-3 TaxID=2913970 RepID=UPI001FC82691|nr:hypothetical protein [Bradyrhizobium sp. Ce-3]GKQ53487.1 hypothetical protein BRSPCE3_43420 [Bradyrhizobium sp. Ce-3]
MKRNAKTCSTSRNAAARLLAVAVLAAVPMSAAAQQFSADLVARKDDTSTKLGTLRVSQQKARIETTALPDGFFLIDTGKPAAVFVRPGARVFMDARQSSPLTSMFVPVDPDDPCRQWQAIAQLSAPVDPAAWHCQRDEAEASAGPSTDAYRITASSGAGFVGWIDRARRFPVRIRTDDGTVIAADHIRDEPQPAQSFEIPAGLRKFDPQALIRRIQQSDVWVEPPASQ